VEYLKNNKYFAQVSGSMEKHAAEELQSFGVEIISEVSRGIRFSCDKETLYKIVYSSRLVQRVLAPIISFQCHSEKYLYNQAYNNIDWTNIIRLDQCFTIIANVFNSNINNSLYAGQLFKDAICDRFKEKYGKRPDFKTKDGDIVLNLYISDNWATIYYDISGISMHKRGYRESSNVAPMQETLAACVIKLCEWDENTPLYDIMCGAGTLLAEALMYYSKIPAGYLRKNQHIQYMPDFDEKLWEKVKTEANSKIRECPKGLLYGSDISIDCIKTTQNNLKNLPFGDNVRLTVSNFKDLPPAENRMIVCNPPYGVRLGIKKGGNDDSIKKLYNDLGDFLKKKCPQSEAYILCGKSDLVSELRLRAHWKKTLKNGDIETKLVKIKIK
jgi:putative N6-adenine-specific DNA methylase